MKFVSPYLSLEDKIYLEPLLVVTGKERPETITLEYSMAERLWFSFKNAVDMVNYHKRETIRVREALEERNKEVSELKWKLGKLEEFMDKVEEMTPEPTDIEDDPIWHTHLLELGFHIKELKKEIK